jgi:dihydroneopterin aldolase
MALLELEGMEFHAFHGCYSEERLVGAQFKVWVSFTCDTSLAEQFDKLADTINYQSIFEIVKKEMEIPSNLIEHLTRRIIDRISTEFPAINSVTVKVSKLNPAISGLMEAVNFTLTNQYA